MKVAFHTLGCKVNIYESEALRQLFETKGYTVVDFDETADVYVINTCSVTAIADRKSRQMIRRAKKRNPSARIIATGCYVHGLPEGSAEELGVDRIIDNKEKNEILQEIRLEKMQELTRATVKIEDGCNQFCTYCIIPFKRGRVKSRDPENILDEIRLLVSSGHKEIVLTGIHLSSYGADFNNDYSRTAGGDFDCGYLLDLIKRIGEIEGVCRIRLGSLEPRIITEEFMRGLSEVKCFCPHFHLSLQSGDDEILRAMNRHYTAEEYELRTNLIRKYFDHPAITTDIIAGFPGEDEKSFERSAEFADRMRFYKMHIFPYSRREGTRAADFPDQLTKAEKERRVDILEEIDAANSRSFEEYYIGKKVTILTEETVKRGDKSFILGHTDTYVPVAIPADRAQTNTMTVCTVKGFLDDEILYGEPDK